MTWTWSRLPYRLLREIKWAIGFKIRATRDSAPGGGENGSRNGGGRARGGTFGAQLLPWLVGPWEVLGCCSALCAWVSKTQRKTSPSLWTEVLTESAPAKIREMKIIMSLHIIIMMGFFSLILLFFILIKGFSCAFWQLGRAWSRRK